MPEPDPQLVLHLEGFEGPMDLLLELARAQKVDLAKISILSLVEQFLAIVESAARIRLELAADWLVMAAWLTWLKSRLLLPPEAEAAEEAQEAASILAARLDALEHIQTVARFLAARPRLGIDVFARGAPERLIEIDTSTLSADIAGLMRGYLAAAKRGATQHGYSPKRAPLWTMNEALARLENMLGRTREWTALETFLPVLSPQHAADPAQRRAAIASTLLAGLEMARRNLAELRQDEPFSPILVRGSHGT